MESEDDNKDNSNSREGQSLDLDYDDLMNAISNQNKQLGGPLIAQTEYRGESSSQGGGGLGSMNTNVGRELAGTN